MLSIGCRKVMEKEQTTKNFFCKKTMKFCEGDKMSALGTLKKILLLFLCLKMLIEIPKGKFSISFNSYILLKGTWQ
jgi:hypothetical protein